ncbi:sulfatase-like hydrolase/transferase [Stieleria sp. TO1_6]|uniref:sulfatase-like hydrolase/transferase n=1 Tax=Stieleria tagensis TaxID=2956795 RepID=UPI00209A7DEF|nr:sulfatase-like hydrolase/transferase [Stieleria tagensis]MCO8121782.1 sulfatase-like hydrolase/transferase [Stieleria tagensis]
MNRFAPPVLCLVIGVFWSGFSNAAEPGQRPNIVWIMSEDNSADYLRHFDPAGAPAPNIEAMAAHGVTFDNAFSNAPVCSVARTTLITGCYAPRIGTQFHRRHVVVPMPPGLKMFPAYLREIGYYTTNHAKEDYNATGGKQAWDVSGGKASWENRPEESTPFFHVETFAQSHESRLHFTEKEMQQPTETDPADVKLQAYFPDTPLFRYTRARYQDRIMQIDALVGGVIEQLQAAGQLENTFVFYFGDHGGVLPRSKGYVYESGLHVPLVVRVPENFRPLADRELGSRTNGFVEFVDFGPTVLRLAGAEQPEGIDGKPFLGADVDPDKVDQRDETFGYADRFDEKYDLVRTLRIGNFKYIRNFEPFYPDGLQNNYRYKCLAYQQWRELFQQGKLTGAALQFFQAKAPEALYDVSTDPDEVNNLAGDPNHAGKLQQLRDQLDDRLKSLPDLSFVTEAVMVDAAIENPTAFGQSHSGTITRYIDTVNLALLPPAQALVQLEAALGDEDPWVRYWALVACSTLGESAKPLVPVIEKFLLDTEPLVVVRAIEFLAINSDVETKSFLYRSLERATNEPEALRMLNTIVYLRDFHGYQVDPDQFRFIIPVEKNGQLIRRLEYLKQQ